MYCSDYLGSVYKAGLSLVAHVKVAQLITFTVSYDVLCLFSLVLFPILTTPTERTQMSPGSKLPHHNSLQGRQLRAQALALCVPSLLKLLTLIYYFLLSKLSCIAVGDNKLLSGLMVLLVRTIRELEHPIDFVMP